MKKINSFEQDPLIERIVAEELSNVNLPRVDKKTLTMQGKPLDHILANMINEISYRASSHIYDELIDMRLNRDVWGSRANFYDYELRINVTHLLKSMEPKATIKIDTTYSLKYTEREFKGSDTGNDYFTASGLEIKHSFEIGFWKDDSNHTIISDCINELNYMRGRLNESYFMPNYISISENNLIKPDEDIQHIKSLRELGNTFIEKIGDYYDARKHVNKSVEISKLYPLHEQKIMSLFRK